MSIIKILKYLKISLYVMFVISIILVFIIIKDSNDNAKLAGSLDTSFYWTYFLLITGLIGIVIFGVYQAITVKGDSKKMIIAIGGLAVIILIAYLFSSNEIPQFFGTQTLIADGTLTPGTARMTDVGLYTTYMLAFISVATLVYTSFSKYWTK